MNEDRGERLQKALAHLGLASRRDVEAWIRAGRLTVNGDPAALGMRVHARDKIRLDGRLVRWRPVASEQVLVCHRSPGEPLDRAGEADRPGLLERLPHAAGRRFVAVSPMPLQDGGLELVTSDGALAERLQRSVRRLLCEYSVRLRGELAEAQLRSVLEGALDSGGRVTVLGCQPSGGEGTNRWYSLSAEGASGRDVRRLFEHTGVVVSRVLRTRLGPVALDRTLARGRFRKLAPDEVAQLREAPPQSPLLSVEAPAGDAAARRSKQREVRTGKRLRTR
jgi:23S rRNA pseudouridine2605 synthase